MLPPTGMKAWPVTFAGLLLSSTAAAQASSPAQSPPSPPAEAANEGATAAEPPRLVEPMTAVPSGRVLVRADFTKVRLERGSGKEWQLVCVAPCELSGDPFRLYTYRVSGVGIRTSDPFRLQRSSHDLVVDVKGSTRDRYALGLTSVIAGGGAVVGGLLFWGIEHLVATDNIHGYDADTDHFGRDAAIICGAVGAVLEVLGILAISGHTSVDVHP